MINIVKNTKYLKSATGLNYLLFSLLILLNFVLRLPSIPHEKGYDTFYIHPLANSISTYGVAQWWINWLSVPGFYAYSYASAVPFLLSGIHQLTSIEMEISNLIYCIIIGLLSIFTSYIVAGKFYNNYMFKYGVSLLFSIAPGIMLFSTWELSTRGLFIIMLPLFIFLFLSQIQTSKKVILSILLLVFLFCVHHYSFFLIPICSIYIFILLLSKTRYFEAIKKYSPYIILFILILFIGLPFISRSLVDSGSRYGWLIISAKTIIRQVGILSIVAVSGFFYTLFKENKSVSELYLLTIFSFIFPVIYSHSYGAFILLFFIILFSGISLLNVTSIPSRKKVVSVCIFSMIIFSVLFTGYYNHYRTGGTEDYWYVHESTYQAGMWGRTSIPDYSYGLDMDFETSRVFTISEGHPITPAMGAVNLAYGFINETEIEYVEHTYFEKEFYFEGPYSIKQGTTVSGKMEWIRQTATSIDELANFDYFVQDKYYSKPVVSVVSASYNKVYDSTRIAIWEYDHD
ncbi:MAG: hypothetical protein PWQ75_697 [Methanolobus sp.]|uniref:hypothetical protein n=1 Tax=Methanolobus sp. TaxID=1874737 RepID=UPI002589CC81|nr:hypothetical protein [Methanolobus sp.]MDK2830945.1 hypothetical protein [Methanolobus sp.]